jgi:hypothetical protein
MARHTCLGIVVLLAISVSAAGVLQAAPGLSQAASADATAAAKASPELVSALSKEMSAMPEQAAGAASSFSKLGLSSDMVSKAVPVLTSSVTKSGGSKAGSLLAGALQ